MNHDAEGQVDFTQIEDAKTAEHVSDSVSPIGAARATSDDVALERLGKKPVLKVENFRTTSLDMTLTHTAQLWVLAIFRLLLHPAYHLGRSAMVCIV